MALALVLDQRGTIGLCAPNDDKPAAASATGARFADSQRAAATDPLTGDWIGAAFGEAVRRELGSACRARPALRLIGIPRSAWDEAVNNYGGHLVGDKVIK